MFFSVIVKSSISGVLDEEEEDVLVNVNIVDDERAEKNVENKKKNPDYKPYDEPEFDEYGMVSAAHMMPSVAERPAIFLVNCKTVPESLIQRLLKELFLLLWLFWFSLI